MFFSLMRMSSGEKSYGFMHLHQSLSTRADLFKLSCSFWQVVDFPTPLGPQMNTNFTKFVSPIVACAWLGWFTL